MYYFELNYILIIFGILGIIYFYLMPKKNYYIISISSCFLILGAILDKDYLCVVMGLITLFCAFVTKPKKDSCEP